MICNISVNYIIEEIIISTKQIYNMIYEDIKPNFLKKLLGND